MDKNKKVLVVDDEADVLDYLVTLFQDNGYETVTADNGLKCIEVAKAEKPDLITLDFIMPEQSGVRAYRQLKRDYPELKDIPVIIITAMGDSMEEYLHKLKGFPDPEGFMNKPIEQDTLIKMAADILSK
jgi:CheY-like chemotaxis protein